MKSADEHRCIFLLAGDEKFLKEEWLKNKKQRFFKEEKSPDLDFNQFYADEAGLSYILSVVKTKPFLSRKRLIILKGIERLSSSDREKLLAYAKRPSLDTILILEIDSTQKAILGNEFLSNLAKMAEVVFFKKLYNRDLSNWINRQFVLKRKRIDPQTTELLIQLKGNDLKMLNEEIEKLIIYTGERSLISLEDIEYLVGRDMTASIYDIIDAISQNDTKEVLTLGFDFQKKDLGAAVGLFCWNLRRLLKAREYLKEGWSAEKIGNALGINRFHVNRFISQVKRFNSTWIKSALSELKDFDLKIKTSGFADPVFGWQMLLVGLLASL